MTKDEALKLALAALESCDQVCSGENSYQYFSQAMVYKATTAIKEALAQPEQEPTDIWFEKCFRSDTPAAQRTWVGLTDEEIQNIHDTYHKRMGPMEFARFIEAKLRNKNEHV